MLDQVKDRPRLRDQVRFAEWGAVEVLVSQTPGDLDPVVAELAPIDLLVAYGATFEAEHDLNGLPRLYGPALQCIRQAL